MRLLAWTYAVSAAVGTVLGIRADLPGAPFGIRTGRSAAFDAVVGYGTGFRRR